jgi:hypothetical protein
MFHKYSLCENEYHWKKICPPSGKIAMRDFRPGTRMLLFGDDSFPAALGIVPQ